jgi:L-threonylcarbamoyladenylate synthase
MRLPGALRRHIRVRSCGLEKLLISKFRLRLAARHLQQGGLIAYPTEGVYGLGCDPFNPDAFSRLLELKHRQATKGVILISADFEQIRPLLRLSDFAIQVKMLMTWPGPVTWVAPATDRVPSWLRGQHTSIAVRVTAHPLAAALCRTFGGPIVSTSANISGRPPARSILGVRKYFAGSKELFFIAGRIGQLRQPTPIYDARNGIRLR